MSAALRPEPLSTPLEQPLLVWVLVPHLDTTDENLAWYCDFEQSRAEFKRAFEALGLPWKWQRVTMANHQRVIAGLRKRSPGHEPIIFNLCDGDESNGVPGLSIIRCLEVHGLRYTGADVRFYDGTTSKIDMKVAFEKAKVPTSPWAIIPKDGRGAQAIIDKIGAPLIIKPAVSAGSMGVTTKSVVGSAEELRAQMKRLRTGYHGWDLTAGGVFAERFVAGREFTTFIVGSHDAPSRKMIYPPVERVFHAALPEQERDLSFDRLWGMYEVERPIGADESEEEDLWQYRPLARAEAKRVREVSWAAYASVQGRGYGRVDLREDARTGELMVLEVNAQCGLSEDENFTSIGAILRFAGKPFHHCVEAILSAALPRARTVSRQVA
jgi:D-alanine-D-alanine ligase